MITIKILLLLIFTASSLAFRLPNNTSPRAYVLSLKYIDDVEFTVHGTSSIEFVANYPTSSVILHASDLLTIDKDYTEIRALDSNETLAKPISQEWSSTTEFFNVTLDRILSVNNTYEIKFKWTAREGKNRPLMNRGFIRRKIEDEHGVEEYVMSTLFAARGARSAFPCWDEPEYLALFTVDVTPPKNYTVISNTPKPDSIRDRNGTKVTIFQTTPPIPPHLLSIVVGPFTGIQLKSLPGTFWAPLDTVEEVKFAAELTPLAYAALVNYTGIKLPLQQMSSVLVPRYPISGFEHWGCITYGDAVRLNPAIDDSNRKYGVANLVAHELTHQWFGGLVLQKWWNDIWLTESFAVFLADKILDRVSSEWHARDLFATRTVNDVSFNADEYSKFGHPIRWNPDTPQRLEGILDPVTYEKGAAVLQMLEHIVSEDVFQKSLKYYFREGRRSVDSNDLWASLQTSYDESQPAVPLNLKKIMEPWIDQTGYPILNVTRNYETGVVTITQSNAISTGPQNRWPIPVNYATSSRPDFNDTRITHWMKPTNDTLEIHGLDKDDWIILNIQLRDFYRVTYDWENLRRISAYLNSDNYHKVHVLNRAQFFYEIRTFPDDKKIFTEVAFNFMSYLHREIHPLPWLAAKNVIQTYISHYINGPSYDSFNEFALRQISNITEHIGFEPRDDDDNLIKVARRELLPLACSLGYERCQAVAAEKLIKNLQSGKPVHQDAVKWVYCSGLEAANETIWELAMNTHIENPRRPSIFRYLGCAKNFTLIEKYLRLALSDSDLMSYDLIDGLLSLAGNGLDTYNFVLDFFIDNVDALERYDNTRKTKSISTKTTYVLYLIAYDARTRVHEEKLTAFLKGKGAAIDRNFGSLKILSDKVNFGMMQTDFFNAIMKKE